MARQDDPQHILLHLDESAPATFAAVLDYAEAFLAEPRPRGAEVEVVANAGGVTNCAGRVALSRTPEIACHLQNLHFIAPTPLEICADLGVQVTVLDNGNAGETAVDHIVRRLRDGWSYVKVSDLPGI